MSSDLKNNVFKEQHLDSTLRPGSWDEYIGQKGTKENLRILISAAKEREHSPEHLLFYGSPGLGKTTLAHLVAQEIGSKLYITSGPAIERVGDLASILTNLAPGEVLFIDEAHRLNKMIEEILYPAMDSGSLNIVIGKGPGARTIQLDLPPFTLIAATTRIALLSGPLRSRFSGGVFRLEFYNLQDIENIIKRSSSILGIDVSPEAIKEIAKRSRSTPRTANHLLKRCRDYAQVKKSPMDKKTIEEAIKLIGIDDVGLTPSDQKILETVITKFGGGPVGLSTIAQALSEEEATVEEVNEPYLIQLGLLERTPRGRIVTKRGYEHLGLTLPKSSQSSLI